MKNTKNLLRWLALIIFIVFGLLYLNGAASSWWLSWGPPNDYPKAWEQESLRRLGFSLTCLFTGPMLFIAFKENFNFKASKYKYIWLLVVILSLTFPHIREFVLTDSCLDSGGEWSEKYFECSMSETISK